MAAVSASHACRAREVGRSGTDRDGGKSEGNILKGGSRFSSVNGLFHCLHIIIRGIYVCVPRNMVQATGMYNTLYLILYKCRFYIFDIIETERYE